MNKTDSTSSKPKKFMSTFDIVLCAMIAAIMFIGAAISLPIGPVPFTLQTFVLFTMLIAFGGRRTSIGVTVYLLLGLIGIPVFAGFTGGFDRFVGATGGFLIGFLVASIAFGIITFLTGWMKNRFKKFAYNYIYYGIIILICDIIMYAFGIIWFVNIYVAPEGATALGNAFKFCVIPFIIPDLIKMIFAIGVGTTLNPIFSKKKK